MIHKKTVHIPAITKKEVSHISCDICGEVGRGRDFKGSDFGDGYELQETSVIYKEGNMFPEGGSGSQIQFDICPDCFTDKLIPWLKSQGADNVDYEDWTY